ncbi:MAG: heme o synthase [Anaerolineae bacterium]|nr:heme o synthase [Anaerolineae bacterium]
MMKLSYSTAFAKLTLFVFLAVILLLVGGQLVSFGSETGTCVGWPTCVPDGLSGWAQLIHRISVGLTAVMMMGLLFGAWRFHRDQIILLPLTASVVILFFIQTFGGAINNSANISDSLNLLHSSTTYAIWLGLFGLVLAAGFLSRPARTAFPALDLRQRTKDIFALAKPIIVVLLLVTTYAGLVMGGRAFPSFILTFWTLLGGALTAGGSGAINQYIDRDLDKNMARTAKRPIASGRMAPAEGLAIGLTACILGVYILAIFVNFLAAFLSLVGILYYVILYSLMLKNVTVQNIVIGGGAGAIPPMVGWAAATGSIGLAAWLLFAIIFLWTPPHFWAFAIVRAKDYERAGVPMLPVIRGERETRRQIFIYTIGLVALTLVVPILSTTGNIYLISAIILGIILIYAAWRVLKIEGNKVAWQMYRISSMYLAFIFLALMMDAVM